MATLNKTVTFTCLNIKIRRQLISSHHDIWMNSMTDWIMQFVVIFTVSEQMQREHTEHVWTLNDQYVQQSPA